MLLLLNTSAPLCTITLIDTDAPHTTNWQADRLLARDLLSKIRDSLQDSSSDFEHITGIGVMKGPGSFTGLRIGLTVANTLAESLEVPIIGESGEDWQAKVRSRLDDGQNDRIVMPNYGMEPNISKQRK